MRASLDYDEDDDFVEIEEAENVIDNIFEIIIKKVEKK
jgi:hypothetical protein